MCDIAFWKEELLAEIQRMEGECDNLGVIVSSDLFIVYIILSDSYED